MVDWQKRINEIMRERDAAMADEYRSGKLVDSIAEKYGLSRSRVIEVVRLYDCKPRVQGRRKAGA